MPREVPGRLGLVGWLAESPHARQGAAQSGSFQQALTDNGVYVRMAALEAPEQIGRGEVHGKIFKKTLKAAVKACKIVGKQKMKYAVSVNCAVNNEHSRKRGHCFFVLGAGEASEGPREAPRGRGAGTARGVACTARTRTCWD